MRLSQHDFTVFCNHLAHDAVERIDDYSQGDERIRTTVIWSLAEIILHEAIQHAYSVGGTKLVAMDMAVFRERMQEFCQEFWQDPVH